MIHFRLAFSIRCMESKLNFVNTVHKAEEGLHSALNSAHELLVSVQSILIVIAGYRYKYTQLANEIKVTNCDSKGNLVVKANVVH